MGLPYVVLTESGTVRWKEILESRGYRVKLDEDEIDRCSANGTTCEMVNHPRLISMYPFCISRDDVVLKCLESKEHNGKAAVTFLLPKNQLEREVFHDVKQILAISGAIAEET